MPNKGYKQFLSLHNRIDILKSGPAFFEAILHQIEIAEFEIHAQFYIFSLDETGLNILNALKRAAQRGVHIYLLMDDFGSKLFPKKILSACQQLGIELKWFAPVKFPFGLGKRLHHKLLVIDRKWAVCGGINISDAYAGIGAHKNNPWLDFAIAVEGEVVLDLLRVCEKYWRAKSKVKAPFHTKNKWQELSQQVGVLQNNWFSRKKYIASYYYTSLRNAKSEIVIVNSYFLPSFRYRKMLIKAAQRGVKISIVLSGKSDVPLMQNAMKFMYQEFLESGIELYEWKQSVLHAKLALFDAKSFTVGSYNLNHLSQFSSVETNLVSTNYEAYLQLQSILNTAVIPKCEPIDKERFLHKRTQLGSFFQYISYSLLISLFRLYQRFMYHQHNS